MSKRPVIVELRHSKNMEALAFGREGTEKFIAAPQIAGLELDPTFPPTPLPGRAPMPHAESSLEGRTYELLMAPAESTYIVRGEIEEEKIDALRADPTVAGVFSDPKIEAQIICPGSPAMGTDADVETLLCTNAMQARGLDGSGVYVAIVDTGINLAHLNAKGKHPQFDAAKSWVPGPGLVPGSLPVDHGTMCAFDACIAAPKCTLLDIAVLQSSATGPSPMSGVLSDAVRAYRHLIDIMLAPRRPGEARSMVVNNSWGMFHPSWDLPVGDPGNYSDNSNHPFNRIVADLERAGADILFAAGNCGADCPDGRCRNVTANAIYGANGHPAVLCVVGADIGKDRVGYSTTGPGRLTYNKPDITGYTHFKGSGVYPADGGTSAATPVVSGVIAAIRSARPYAPGNPSTYPSAIKALVTSTAEDRGSTGYDFEYGFGIINGCELAKKFPLRVLSICQRYPELCRPPINICRRYPWLCRPEAPRIPRIPPIPQPPIPLPDPEPWRQPVPTGAESGWGSGMVEGTGIESASEAIALAYQLGYHDGSQGRGVSTAAHVGHGSGDCGCGGKKSSGTS